MSVSSGPTTPRDTSSRCSGTRVTRPAIFVSPSVRPPARSGVLSRTHSSGTSEDRETYRNGRAEEFDAWSDNLGPRFMSWRKWVQRGAMRLLRVCRCRLCGTSIATTAACAHSHDQRHMLCPSCCSDVSHGEPTPRLWPLGSRRCAIYDMAHVDSALLYEDPHGKLCVPCVKAMNPLPSPSHLQRLLRQK